MKLELTKKEEVIKTLRDEIQNLTLHSAKESVDELQELEKLKNQNQALVSQIQQKEAEILTKDNEITRNETEIASLHKDTSKQLLDFSQKIKEMEEHKQKCMELENRI